MKQRVKVEWKKENKENKGSRERKIARKIERIRRKVFSCYVQRREERGKEEKGNTIDNKYMYSVNY
jgi:hypothetical protein